MVNHGKTPRQVEDLMSLDFDVLTQTEDFLEELVPRRRWAPGWARWGSRSRWAPGMAKGCWKIASSGGFWQQLMTKPVDDQPVWWPVWIWIVDHQPVSVSCCFLFFLFLVINLMKERSIETSIFDPRLVKLGVAYERMDLPLMIKPWCWYTISIITGGDWSQ